MNFKWSNGLNNDDFEEEDDDYIYQGEKPPVWDFFEWNIHQYLWCAGVIIIILNLTKYIGYWVGYLIATK